MFKDLEQLRAELGSRRRAKPFAPFAFRLKDGRRVVANAPLRYGFNDRYAIVMTSGDHPRVEQFPLAEIASLEPLAATSN